MFEANKRIIPLAENCIKLPVLQEIIQGHTQKRRRQILPETSAKQSHVVINGHSATMVSNEINHSCKQSEAACTTTAVLFP